MIKSAPVIFCAALCVLILSGCGFFGAVKAVPRECIFEPPLVMYADKPKDLPIVSSATLQTKEYLETVLKKPDNIEKVSGNAETWIYKKPYSWCGLGLGIFIPVPLILPICDRIERVEFENNRVKRIRIRRVVEMGAMCLLPSCQAFRETDEPCRLPIVKNVYLQGTDKSEQRDSP